MSNEVIIYRDLLDRVRHNGKWSIAAVAGKSPRKVIGHADDVVLSNVRFVVKEKRRQIIAAGGHREVHAWAIGTIVDELDEPETVDITYRPHQCGSFFRRDNGQAISSAKYVRFRSDGTAAAFQPQ
jgi:hypothetical protein